VAPGLLIVLAAAAVLRAKARLGFVRSVVVAGLAVPAVVLLRVVIETAADPTSHNLWPFEVVIGAGVGALVALAGALAGIGFEWLARMRRR
jgi:hypothetical protein